MILYTFTSRTAMEHIYLYLHISTGQKVQATSLLTFCEPDINYLILKRSLTLRPLPAASTWVSGL